MNALHPLGRLIQSVEDSRGWTLREIARRATKAGYEISHQYVARLKRSDLKSISRELIAALGAGLDVPERVVGLAALESMGVHDVDPSEADLAATIARDSSLTERDRRVLLAAVREMQREQDDEQDGERAAPAGSGGVEDPPELDGVMPDDDLWSEYGRTRRKSLVEHEG